MILRAVLAVALLLVGSPMPDWSKVMTQTKRVCIYLTEIGLTSGGIIWATSYEKLV
jgi:hypothetical protein